MKKIVVIENIRRAWLSNIINTYPLLFIVPFYIVMPEQNPILLLAYAYVSVTIMAYLLTKIAIILQRSFEKELNEIIRGPHGLELTFMTIYGDCEPRIIRFFVPLMILLTLVIDTVPLSWLVKFIFIFTVIFAIIFGATYFNITSVRKNLDKIIELLEG